MSRQTDLESLKDLRDELIAATRKMEHANKLEEQLNSKKKELKNPQEFKYNNKSTTTSKHLKEKFLKENSTKLNIDDKFEKIWVFVGIIFVLIHLVLLFGPVVGLSKIPIVNIPTYITPERMQNRIEWSKNWSLYLGIFSSLLLSLVVLLPVIKKYWKKENPDYFFCGIFDLDGLIDWGIYHIPHAIAVFIAWLCSLFVYELCYKTKNYDMYFIAIYFMVRIPLWLAEPIRNFIIKLKLLTPKQYKAIKEAKVNDKQAILDNEAGEIQAKKDYDKNLVERKAVLELRIKELEKEVIDAKESAENAYKTVERLDCLSSKDKNLKTVNSLIELISTKRADSIKEALQEYDKIKRDEEVIAIENKKLQTIREQAAIEAESKRRLEQQLENERFYERTRAEHEKRVQENLEKDRYYRQLEEEKRHNKEMEKAVKKFNKKLDKANKELKEIKDIEYWERY